MKRMILILLLACNWCMGAGLIETLQDLKDAADGTFGTGSPYTIHPGTYVFDGQIAMDINNTVITHDGTTGDVVFDLSAATSRLVYRNATGLELSGIDDDHRINIIDAQAEGIRIQMNASNTVVEFNYLDITGSTSNGLDVGSGASAGLADVTLNNCNSFLNTNDGFSMESSALAIVTSTLRLNNCNSYTNGVANSGDGVTAHRKEQYVIVNGGSYYGNGKGGAAIVGGAEFVAYGGAEFYDNGTTVFTQGNIFLGLLALNDITIGRLRDISIYVTSGANATAKQTPLINIQEGTLYLDSCTLDGENHTGVAGLIRAAASNANSACMLDIQSMTIKNLPDRADSYGIHLEDDAVYGAMKNCTVVGDGIGVKWDTAVIARFTAINNIFDLTRYAFDCTAEDYSRNPISGYNCFWGQSVEADYFNNDTGGFNEGDFQANPGFVDPDGGDFTITNPTLKNSGLNGSYIGSVQPASTSGNSLFGTNQSIYGGN